MFAAFDFETALIRPALQAPPPVCMSVALGDVAAEVYATADIPEALGALLDSEPLKLVGHNVAYDCACAIEWLGPEVAAKIWRAYEDGRIVDTMIVERLAEIAGLTSRKVLSLDVCCQAHGLPALDKDSGVRLDFGRFLGRPLADYPEPHIAYVLADATAPLKLLERQLKRYGRAVSLQDVAFMSRKAFWLQLTRNYGLRTDPEKLAQLRAATLEHVEELRELAQEIGFVRANGTRDMKAIRAYITEAYSGRPPRTKTGNVATARAVLEESGDVVLEAFADYGEWSAVQNKDLPMLELGAEWPIHTKFGIADTTRTTSAKPNVQNLRRKEGIRECFVPREGCCYVAADHSGLENCTLAQVIVSNLNRWDMADKINRGEDLHCHVGAQIARTDYATFYQRARIDEDSAAKNQRNCAKVVNFGRPGGMGARTLSFYAKQAYHLDLSVDFCKQLIEAWNAANPDGMAYLDWINGLPEDAAGFRAITIPGTTILRRRCTYCAAANSHFQGLGAVVEAHVGFAIAREIYDDSKKSVLRVARLCNFVHDEFILETPIGTQHEVAERLTQIMATEAKRYLPDIKIEAEAVAMGHWSKRAKRIVRNGELQIWQG